MVKLQRPFQSFLNTANLTDSSINNSAVFFKNVYAIKKM